MCQAISRTLASRSMQALQPDSAGAAHCCMRNDQQKTCSAAGQEHVEVAEFTRIRRPVLLVLNGAKFYSFRDTSFANLPAKLEALVADRSKAVVPCLLSA